MSSAGEVATFAENAQDGETVLRALETATALCKPGALLADVPHTRRTQIIATATDADLIDRFDLEVVSPYGTPDPAVGTHTYDYGTPVTASVPLNSVKLRLRCSRWVQDGLCLCRC